MGAKGALEVKQGLTFIDFAVQQIEHLNSTQHVDIPLLFMTSFKTSEDSQRIIRRYANQPVRITTFNQSRFPRISNESFLPCAMNAQDDKSVWYPPGHGDLYNSLHVSGVLDKLLEEGKEYLFISNCDNLGAMLVLKYACCLKPIIEPSDFCMVTVWTQESFNT